MNILITIFCMVFIAMANDPFKGIDKADLDKLTPEQKTSLAMIMLMGDHQVNLKIKYKTAMPQVLRTGFEGQRFISKIPIVTEKTKEIPFENYKNNPAISYTPSYFAEEIKGMCGNCFSSFKRYPAGNFDFNFYPTGSEFKIVSMIMTPDRYLKVILQDSKGSYFFASEFILGDMVDGGYGGLQNFELTLIDTLIPGKDVIKMRVSNYSWQYIQESLRKAEVNWNYPAFHPKVYPNPEPRTNEEWLRFFVKGFMGHERSMTISNEVKEEHKTSYDLETDVKTFVLLIYSDLIELEGKTEPGFHERFKQRLAAKPDRYFFNKPLKELLSEYKSNVKPIPEPTKEESQQAAKELLEIKEKKRIENR